MYVCIYMRSLPHLEHDVDFGLRSGVLRRDNYYERS